MPHPSLAHCSQHRATPMLFVRPRPLVCQANQPDIRFRLCPHLSPGNKDHLLQMVSPQEYSGSLRIKAMVSITLLTAVQQEVLGMHAWGGMVHRQRGRQHAPTVLAVVSTADDCAAGPPKLGGMLKPPAPGPPAPKLGNPGGLQATTSASQYSCGISHEHSYIECWLYVAECFSCSTSYPLQAKCTQHGTVAKLRCGKGTGANCQ